MSELYSIKKETLTGIADALRAKHGETEIVEGMVPKVVVNKTSNATGFKNISGSSDSSPDGYYVSTIDGANTIKVKMLYSVWYTSTAQGWCDTIEIASGAHTATTFPVDSIKYSGWEFERTTTPTIVEHTFEGTDSITICWRSGWDTSNTGYYAEIIGYDANGEVITEPGKVEVKRTFTSDEVAGAIDDLLPAPPEEAFVITGDCGYRFANSGWDWFMEQYGNKVTTKDINKAERMFLNCQITSIPFEINCTSDTSVKANSMFDNCSYLTEIPKIKCKPSGLDGIFTACNRVRYLPEDIVDWFDWSYIDSQTSGYNGNTSAIFQGMKSLRTIPIGFFEHGNRAAAPSCNIFYGESSCYSLDELLNIPIIYTATWTSNGLYMFMEKAYRLQSLTFAMPDGQPYVKNWKNQTLNLSSSTGYGFAWYEVENYNSGITADKEVKDDATYQALKNDPDWFTQKVEYSRYNKESAIATINSLPDTSAYLASAGGTNTIKFTGAAGSKTDGGAINTMTEEEIAVAAAKGWTVTFA